MTPYETLNTILAKSENPKAIEEFLRIYNKLNEIEPFHEHDSVRAYLMFESGWNGGLMQGIQTAIQTKN